MGQIRATELFERACYEARLTMLLDNEACVAIIDSRPSESHIEIIRVACRYDDLELARAFYPEPSQVTMHPRIIRANFVSTSNHDVICACYDADAKRIYRDFTHMIATSYHRFIVTNASGRDPKHITDAMLIQEWIDEIDYRYHEHDHTDARLWNIALITQNFDPIGEIFMRDPEHTSHGNGFRSNLLWTPTSPQKLRDLALSAYFVRAPDMTSHEHDNCAFHHDADGDRCIAVVASRYIDCNPRTWSLNTLRAIMRIMTERTLIPGTGGIVLDAHPNFAMISSRVHVSITGPGSSDDEPLCHGVMPGIDSKAIRPDHFIERALAISNCGLRIHDIYGYVINHVIVERVNSRDAENILKHLVRLHGYEHESLWCSVFHSLLNVAQLIDGSCFMDVAPDIGRLIARIDAVRPSIGQKYNKLIGALLGSPEVARLTGSQVGQIDGEVRRRMYPTGLLHAIELTIARRGEQLAVQHL
jgi:hypothetical protein